MPNTIKYVQIASAETAAADFAGGTPYLPINKCSAIGQTGNRRHGGERVSDDVEQACCNQDPDPVRGKFGDLGERFLVGAKIREQEREDRHHDDDAKDRRDDGALFARGAGSHGSTVDGLASSMIS